MAGSGIERSKEPVFRQHFSFSERIEEGRLSGIGIANHGYDRNGLGCTLAAMHPALMAYFFDLFTQIGYTATDTPAINLQSCLTRATHADSTTKAACTSTARTARLDRKSVV